MRVSSKHTYITRGGYLVKLIPSSLVPEGYWGNPRKNNRTFPSVLYTRRGLGTRDWCKVPTGRSVYDIVAIWE